jgi:tetratricopeptide (TPR) repeat protein
MVVVTSRNRLSGLVATEGAHSVSLDLLTAEEARELLMRRLGVRRVASEPQAVNGIIAACGQLPLALAIVAARAATVPKRSLTTVSSALRAAPAALEPFTGKDPLTDLRTVFSFSYRNLSPGAASVFRFLSLHPGPDTCEIATASLAGISLTRARQLLNELVESNLVSESTAGRYSVHDLLRAYARELVHDVDEPEQRHAALRRCLDHYLHTAHAAALLLFPSRTPLPLASPAPEVAIENPGNHKAALDWFAAEHAVLLAAVEQASSHGLDIHAWQLSWSLLTYLDRRGHWQELMQVYDTGMQAATRQQDQLGQAHCRRGLARAHIRLRDYDGAYRHLQEALKLYGIVDDVPGQAHTLNNISQVLGFQDRFSEAADYAKQALDLYEVSRQRSAYVHALNDVGWFHAMLGEYQQALAYCREALIGHEQAGDRHGEANTSHSLGYIYHHLGCHRQAVTHYRRALALFEEFGNQYYQAETLAGLGEALGAVGDDVAAQRCLRQAAGIFDQLDRGQADGATPTPGTCHPKRSGI